MMRSKTRMSLLVALLLVLALCISSCAATTGAPAVEVGGTTAATAAPTEPAPVATATPDGGQSQAEVLRIVTSVDISTLDPLASRDWSPYYGVGELLMYWDGDFEVKPWLLESLEQIDELNWRLTLRQNVTFQNGKVLDADALAALIRHRLEKAASAQADLAGATVEVTGPYEVVLTTAEPNPGVPNVLANESDFPVYDVEALEAVGDDYASLAGNGMYTGPYEVVSLDDQALTLQRYEGYWQGMPALAVIRIGFVPDAQARILAVQNGEADIALYPPSDAKPLLEDHEDAFFVTAPVGCQGVRLILKVEAPPFDDSRVRRALGLGIDYEELAKDVLNGVYAAAKGYYPLQFEFALANQEYDPEAAARLLAEAGWEMGDDGIRYKNGLPLHISLVIYPLQPDLEPMSVAVQARLREIGFDVEIVSVDDINATLREDQVAWNAGLWYAGSVSGGGGLRLSRYIHSEGDRNYGGIDDPELDALIDELDVTFDEQRRTELLQEIQTTIVDEEGYQYFAAFKLFPVVVSPAYRDYVPSHNFRYITFETKPTNP